MTDHAPAPLRVLLAGAGAFGREHLLRLEARANVRIAGIADPDASALAAMRQRHATARCFDDPMQMLAETPADAIIVATPAASHAGITLRAIEGGLGVLLEKPVTPGAAEALRLAKVAAVAGVLVLPGHVLRFSRDHQRLAEIVASGAIGRVLYISSRRYRDEAHVARYGEIDPVLMTMIHDIDLAAWFARSPFRQTRAWRSGMGGARALTSASAVTDSGIICNLRTAWTFTAGELPPDRVEVVGETGSVELDTGRGLVLHAQGRRTIIPLAPGDDALANEQEHFFACLRDRSRSPAITLEDAAAGLRLAEAICESLREGREVALRT